MCNRINLKLVATFRTLEWIFNFSKLFAPREAHVNCCFFLFGQSANFSTTESANEKWNGLHEILRYAETEINLTASPVCTQKIVFINCTDVRHIRRIQFILKYVSICYTRHDFKLMKLMIMSIRFRGTHVCGRSHSRCAPKRYQQKNLAASRSYVRALHF